MAKAVHSIIRVLEESRTVQFYQKAFATHGDGYGHLAVSAENIDGEHQRMSSIGLEPIQVKEFFRNSALMAKFFLVQDPDGYKIEVLQRQGRYT